MSKKEATSRGFMLSDALFKRMKAYEQAYAKRNPGFKVNWSAVVRNGITEFIDKGERQK
jgi:hypothetical protein